MISGRRRRALSTPSPPRRRCPSLLHTLYLPRRWVVEVALRGWKAGWRRAAFQSEIKRDPARCRYREQSRLHTHAHTYGVHNSSIYIYICMHTHTFSCTRHAFPFVYDLSSCTDHAMMIRWFPSYLGVRTREGSIAVCACVHIYGSYMYTV